MIAQSGSVRLTRCVTASILAEINRAARCVDQKVDRQLRSLQDGLGVGTDDKVEFLLSLIG